MKEVVRLLRDEISLAIIAREYWEKMGNNNLVAKLDVEISGVEARISSLDNKLGECLELVTISN